METPSLTRKSISGVSFLTDGHAEGQVRFGFTERTGGVSEGVFASLNLGDACGDMPEHVAENRARALAALGYEGSPDRLVNPKQVHGDKVLLVDTADEESLARIQKEAREGADAIVCTVPGVPVLLCYADCVPVILATEKGFAVIHSGWRGTIASIAAKALVKLLAATEGDASSVVAYIGPHIAGPDYEVSEELLTRFVDTFDESVALPGHRLDLARAIVLALEGAGIGEESIVDCGISTARATDRFYSYRAEGGHCGRHGALAYLAS